MRSGRVDLAAVAARAVGVPVRSAQVVQEAPIAYDPFIPGRTVSWVTGLAETDAAGSRSWAAVVKRREGPDLGAARRELDAYRLGLGRESDALRAPALLASSAGEDHVELWLEEVADEFGGSWPLPRFAVAVLPARTVTVTVSLR